LAFFSGVGLWFLLPMSMAFRIAMPRSVAFTLNPVLINSRFVFVTLFDMFLAGRVRARKNFSRQRLYGSGGLHRSGMAVRLGMRMAVIVVVVFEIFKNVADVKERIAIQADVDECRLHSRQDARHAALINAADEREFFFALDVNFY
jgi:hypothetical protein